MPEKVRNDEPLEGVGAGIRRRAGQLTAERVRAAAEQLWRDLSYREGAGRLMCLLQDWDTGKVFMARGPAQLEQ